MGRGEMGRFEIGRVEIGRGEVGSVRIWTLLVNNPLWYSNSSEA